MNVNKCFLLLTLLFFSTDAIIAEDQRPKLSVYEVIDLKKDGCNVFEFSSKTRDLFVAFPENNNKLYQWNIDKKKIVHTYTCPEGHWDEAKVSPDGKLLVASVYPPDFKKVPVYFIDTATHKILSTFYYKYPIREIRVDKTGKFVWLEPTYPGPDDFVWDIDGEEAYDFNPKDFLDSKRDRLWIVDDSKGGPPPGLFYKDSRGVTHKLVSNPLEGHFSSNEKFIVATTIDARIRIWRTRDLKEVYNEEIGGYPVRLKYDSRENRFLILNGADRNTKLKAIDIPSPKDTVPALEDQFDWNNSVSDFIDMLKKRKAPYTVWICPKGWVKKTDLPMLFKLIDSEEKCAPVVSAFSSYLPTKRSTVGREAMFLIKGFMKGRYPPVLSSDSFYFKPDKESLKKWWKIQQK